MIFEVSLQEIDYISHVFRSHRLTIWCFRRTPKKRNLSFDICSQEVLKTAKTTRQNKVRRFGFCFLGRSDRYFHRLKAAFQRK